MVRRLNQSAEDFSSNVGDGVFRQIHSEDGCTFFVGGRCQIYEDRPIDCRLFPVDICEQDDGTLIWIVWVPVVTPMPRRSANHRWHTLLPIPFHWVAPVAIPHTLV